MKVLAVTYRFGEEFIGGAEHYLLMLSKALVKLGATVEVATTRTQSLRGVLRFGVRWDNELASRNEIIDGVNIRRFTCFNLPKVATLLLCYLLQRQWDAEESLDEAWDDFELGGEGCIGPGWHLPERYGATVLRWTKREARFVIADSVTEIGLTVRSPKHGLVRVLLDGKEIGAFRGSGEWQQYRFPATGSGRVHGLIECERLWRPLRDSRRLGIAVSEMFYSSAGVRKEINLSENFLLRLKKETVVAKLMRRAATRPWIFDAFFTILRYPPSPGLISFVNTQASDYDLIVGHNVPFGTINLAVDAAKRRARPVVLVPLSHVDDDFYHWSSYYQAFRQADLILAISQYAAEQFYDRLGTKAVTVGAGVDRAEFEASVISGARFRQKYNLQDIPMVLFVGRKSFLKRYDLLVKAVDAVNADCPCKLVIIGPDEDHISIDSRNVLVLGSLNRSDVIDAYDACDVFGLMSESESFGMVFLEAWMRRKPVIGNKRCGPVASLIKDGVDGYLCQDEYDCAGRIKSLLTNPFIAKTLGENGYQKVVERFTWDQIGKQVFALYGDLLAARSAPGH